MIVIAISDCHLSPFIWNSHRSILGDSYFALGMITGQILGIKEAMPQDEKLVLLIAGDIFDSTTPDSYTEEILKKNLAVLHEAGVIIRSIQGNHEYHAKKARATLFDSKELTMTPEIIDGVSFCGIDYTASTEELHEKLSRVPPCDYLVMHSPFRHLLGFEDKYQVEKDDIPAHVKAVIVGDIHKQMVIQNAEKTFIISPGATHPRKIPEIKEGHGMYMIKHEAGPGAGQFVNVESRKFYEVNIINEDDMETLRTLDVTQGEAPLPPVIILKAIGEFYKKAVALAESKGALVVPKEHLVVNTQIRTEEALVDIPELIEALPQVLMRKAEPEAFSLLEQLLTTTDPQVVLEATRDRFLKEAV